MNFSFTILVLITIFCHIYHCMNFFSSFKACFICTTAFFLSRRKYYHLQQKQIMNTQTRTQCIYNQHPITVYTHLMPTTPPSLHIQLNNNTPPNPTTYKTSISNISDMINLQEHFEDLQQLLNYIKIPKNIKIQADCTKILVVQQPLTTKGKQIVLGDIQLVKVIAQGEKKQIQERGPVDASRNDNMVVEDTMKFVRIWEKDGVEVEICLNKCLMLRITHRVDKNKADIYNAKIFQLKQTHNLDTHFDSIQNLVQYMKQPTNIQVDIPQRKIIIFAKIQTKKGKTIQIGSLPFTYTNTIQISIEQAQLNKINKQCKQMNEVNGQKLTKFVQTIADIVLGLVKSRDVIKDKAVDVIGRLDVLEKQVLSEEHVQAMLDRRCSKQSKQVNFDTYYQRFEDLNTNVKYQKQKLQKQINQLEERIKRIETQIQEMNKVNINQQNVKEQQKIKQEYKRMRFNTQNIYCSMNNLQNEAKKSRQKSQNLMDMLVKLGQQKQEMQVQMQGKGEKTDTDYENAFVKAADVEDICDLQIKERISMNFKQFGRLPNKLCGMFNLKVLHLHSNKLVQLPKEFGKLQNLEVLVIYNNLLTQLPDSFGQLTSLNNLDISQNKLKQLPSSFPNLTSITKLYLQKNMLQCLPQQFGNIKSLQSLWIYQNKFEVLPQSFMQLTNLQWLSISLFANIPYFLAPLNLTQLYLYYRKFIQKYLNQIKVFCIKKNIKLKYKYIKEDQQQFCRTQ